MQRKKAKFKSELMQRKKAKFKSKKGKMEYFFLLGSRGGFLFEPPSDLADVAAEDGGGLLDVATEEENSSADANHRQDEVGQSHCSQKKTLEKPSSRSSKRASVEQRRFRKRCTQSLD